MNWLENVPEMFFWNNSLFYFYIAEIQVIFINK
jgi:hypothetical protein